METVPERRCPLHDNVDRRKSADVAIRNTKPHEGSHWVKKPGVARKILRSKNARQAGASADMVKFKNPEHAPVFFLDGTDHSNKRRKTQRFLSPQAISDQHYLIMKKVSGELIEELKKQGHAKLENLSFILAIEVVSEILGSSLMMASNSTLARTFQHAKRAFHLFVFFAMDVRPAIKARRTSRKEDAISFYLDEGYSNFSIVIECLTYGTAGMLTTREFIIMVAWYLFENEPLRERFLAGDVKTQLSILMEILRLEPVAALIHRRVNEVVDGVEKNPLPPGEKYGIDIRTANIDEEMVGECPFALDPDRAVRQKDSGRYLSFGDGPHSCPGWQVALQETRIFLEQLFRVPGIKLDRNPDISWNNQLGSYELRNADISCVKAD